MLDGVRMSSELREFLITGRIPPGIPGVSVREMEKAWGRAEHFKPRSTLSKFAWYGTSVGSTHYCNIAYDPKLLTTDMMNIVFQKRFDPSMPAPLRGVIAEILRLSSTRTLAKLGFRYVNRFQGEITWQRDWKESGKVCSMHIGFHSVRRRGKRLKRVFELTTTA